MKRFVRKLQRSAQTYFVLTGIGAAALIAAPVAAIVQLLQPAPSKKKSSALNNELTEHLKDKISEVAAKANESISEVAEDVSGAFGVGDAEVWLKDHNKLHRGKTDEEWDEEYGQTP